MQAYRYHYCATPDVRSLLPDDCKHPQALIAADSRIAAKWQPSNETSVDRSAGVGLKCCSVCPFMLSELQLTPISCYTTSQLS